MIRRIGFHLRRHARRVFTWQTALRMTLLVVTLSVAFASWLVATESGARWTIGWVSGLVPDFRVRYRAGTLLGPLELREVVFKGKTRIDVDDVFVDWSPGALLVGELHITELRVGTLRVAQPAPAANRPKVAPKLPDIDLPLDLRIDRVTVASIAHLRGEKEARYNDIALGFDWQDANLAIDHFVVGGVRWETAFSGTLVTAGDWPLDSKLRLSYPRGGEPSFTFAGSARGPLAEVAVVVDTQGLLDSRIDGTMSPLVPGIPFTAKLFARHAQVPPRAPADRAASIDGLSLSGSGDLAGQFRLDGNASIDTPWSEPVAARVSAAGSWRGMDEVAIAVDDPRLRATLTIDYGWLDGQHFAGRLDVRHLDLVLTNPKLHSRLAGSLQVAGRIPPAPAPGERDPGPRFDIRIDALAGELQGREKVLIRGPLRWQDGHWTFDDLDLRQGVNVAVLRGTLGDNWNANATLNLPDLHGLLPEFTGRATGSAQLVGAPGEPQFAVRLDAQDVVLPAVDLPAPLSRPMHIPMADWSLVGNATLADIEILEAHTVNAPFSILARGNVGWADDLEWDIDSQFAGIALAHLVDDIFHPADDDDGRISGNLASTGRMGTELDAFTVDTDIRGHLAGQPLAMRATLDWQPDDMLLQRLELAHGNNRLKASGMLNPQRVSLALDADAPALQDSLRELAGSVKATATLDGARAVPDASVQFTATGLQWQDWAIASLDGLLELADGGNSDSKLELRAGEITRATPNAAPVVIDSLGLAATGTRDAHRIGFNGASGPLAIAVATEGGFADGDWYGNLARGSIDINRWHWEAVGEPALHLRYAPATADSHDTAALADRVHLQVDPHCWSDTVARFCFTESAELGSSGKLAFETFHLPLDALLAELLPMDTVVQGRVGGTFSAQWEDGLLQSLDAELRNGSPLRIALAGDQFEPERHIAAIDELGASARLADGAWQARATLAGKEAGRIAAQAAIDRNDSLAGQLDIAGLRIDLLEAFTYQVHRLGGTIDATLTLGGSRSAPRVNGTLGLHDGRFAFTRLPLAVEQLNLDGRFDGDRLQLDGSFLTPDSPAKARIDGEFVLNGGDWHGEASLTGNGLAVAMPPQFQFTVSPRLRLVANRKEVAVTGDVRVPWGRIKMKKLPVQSVSLSDDVVLVHADTAADQGGVGIRQRVDIYLLLGDDIRFDAFGGKGQLTGDLRLRSTPELPMQVDGELHVKDGEYSAFGQQLKLRYADIIFNGPIDRPLVEALAVREINDAAVREVGVQLSGSLHTPQSTLWSSPELPQEEALVWLTTGRALSDGPVDLRGEAAQAAVAMGMVQGSVLLSQAGQGIGLRDVQLSTGGDGEEAEVQVGTHVSERVFVGYNQRVFTGDSSVMMRLQLSKRFMLEALSGVESAIDVFYTFEF